MNYQGSNQTSDIPPLRQRKKTEDTALSLHALEMGSLYLGEMGSLFLGEMGTLSLGKIGSQGR